jgi:hypothetical protein
VEGVSPKGVRTIGPLTSVRNSRFHLCIIAAAFCCLQVVSGVAGARGESAHVARSGSDTSRTVILGDSTDAYYGLARELAELEGAPLIHGLDELLGAEPVFVLWVLSPGAFSDSLLTRFGVAVAEKALTASWGIITGSTVDLSRELYERSFSFTGALARADAREHAIFIQRGGAEEIMPLDAEALSGVLKESEYFMFSGHGGGRYWRLDEETPFGKDGIPSLPPLVAATGACNTFRPWIDGSIALAFTDRGAAAYAGFLFSPAPYYLIGHPDGFPMRHSWHGFTAGQVVAVQNAGSMKGFAVMPFYHMLGDPRLAFLREPPYRIVDDLVSGDERTLTFAGAPAGFIPVRIEGAAEFGFVEIPGVSSSGEQDYFYNCKLQTWRTGDDLLVLFEHGGGGFTVRLEKRPHPMRPLYDGLIDAFDHAYVFLPSTNGTTFLLIISACVILGTIWFVMRKGLKIYMFREALLMGACLALLKAFYALLRVDHISVVSYECSFNPYFFVGTFVLTGCGAFFFFNVGSRLWKTVSLLVATFPTWVIAGFWIAGITYINLFWAAPQLGTRLYRYSIGLLPAIAFAAESLVLLPAMTLMRRRVGGRD